MQTFITSDLHFYHKNILKFSPERAEALGVDNMEDMNEALIKHWNSIVSPNDTVYHLGDFSFNQKEVRNLIEKLNGKKVSIIGNHDNIVSLIKCEHNGYNGTWNDVTVTYYKEIQHNGHDIILFHYPINIWNKQERGSLHFYGHVHGCYDNHGRSMDVGFDKHFRILTLDEAVDMVKDREIIKARYNN